MKKSRSLSEIQMTLHDAIKNQSEPTLLCAVISEKPPLSTTGRIDVYKTAYRLRMIESLRDDFSTLEEHTDAEHFERLAKDFLLMYPSRYQNLAEVSQHFPEFVKQKYPDLYQYAVQDWLEILSTLAAEPNDTEVISAEEIQAGALFKLKCMPATQVALFEEQSHLSFRTNGEINSATISHIEAHLLLFLKEGRTQEELLTWAQANSLGEEALAQYITRWIQLNIVFCERVITI